MTSLYLLFFALTVSVVLSGPSTEDDQVMEVFNLVNNSTEERVNLTEQGDDRIPGGLFFRLSQTGVNYVTQMASDALPELLIGQTLPPTDDGTYSITNVKIERFDKPTIDAKFISSSGVSANVTLPQVRVNGMYSAKTFFMTKEGKFRADVQNLTLKMHVRVTEDHLGKHLVEVPLCNGTTDSVLIVFAGGMSTTLNLVRSTVQKLLLEKLGSMLCQTAVDATKFLKNEKELALMTTPAPTTPASSGPSVDADGESDEAWEKPSFGAALCAQEDISDSGAVTKGAGGSREWGIDVSLRMGPVFSDNHTIFGIDGGVLYYGQVAQAVPRPLLPSLPIGNRMIGFLISDYIPNTFFSHVFDHDLGNIREQMRAKDLPGVFKPIVKLVCSNCEVRLLAVLTDKPKMIIDEKGARLDIKGDVSIVFDGFKKVEIVKASAHFDITVKPYVRHSRLYGDVSLTNVDVNVREVGIGGLFGNAIENVLNVIVPKQLWPKIKRRLRFALNSRGIKLPVLCGVELERLNLSYIDHAILIDTDFTYDMASFTEKFKSFMQAKLAADAQKRDN